MLQTINRTCGNACRTKLLSGTAIGQHRQWGQTLVKQLLADGYYLAGVPGFYRDKDDQQWTFVQNLRGILIPVRDRMGRIQGLQIRRDNVIKRKFRWVSSAERLDACRAEGWVHIAGPVREEVLLTEGPMKGDIIHHLTGQTVVAVPGVNTLAQLEKVLTELMDLGVKHIMTAFDMDFMMNHHVQNGYFGDYPGLCVNLQLV